MKRFNTTAVCIPEKHYMVDISDKIEEIKVLVDSEKYFTINRARQYGKTTVLEALSRRLSGEYDVISLDFQDITGAVFYDESTFTKGLAQVICDTRDALGIPVPDEYYDKLLGLAGMPENLVLNDLFRVFDGWCRENSKPVVLVIDEVDTATNNQVFLDFLGKLRSNYLKREKNPAYKTFYSVILAGVTDIKHLKGKIRPDSAAKVNSPWNIAADFDVDMSLSEEGIRGMLDEYESDHSTGMDTAYMAKLIYEETSGYPFLVSRICQLIDEKILKEMPAELAWGRAGFLKAVKMILSENSTLFQTITKNLNVYPNLKASIRSILMEGTKFTYNFDQDDIGQMAMYGLVKNDNNSVKIANRLFETRLYNLFISEEEMKNNVFYNNGELERNQFIKNGKLDMSAIFEGFIRTYNQVVEKLVDRFREEEGREFFLLYLKPIINGTGNFYIESQTRDQLRTDVIVDYLGEQYIIELKIWHGPRYNEEGEAQIRKYLDRFGLETGYMLSFNFNKDKEQGVKEIEIDGKKLIEATV